MIPHFLLRWSDVAIGATVSTGENAAAAATRARIRCMQLAGEALTLRQRLAERGAAERVRGMQMMDGVLIALATSPLVDLVVDAQLERVLRLLESEPERIRALIRGQRENMVDEVVGRVRAGAAAGDEAVDRFTLKMGRREPTDLR